MTLSCADWSVTFVNPSPNDWRMLGNHFATNCRLVNDKVPIHHHLIANQPQIGHCHIAHRWRAICDQHKTSLRPLGDQWNLWATKLVAVSLFCTLKRQLATNLVRRPIRDLLVTSIKPFRDLWDLSAVVSFFWSQSDRIAVASYVWPQFNGTHTGKGHRVMLC